MIRLYLIAALVAAVALLIGGVVWLNGARKAAESRSRAAGNTRWA